MANKANHGSGKPSNEDAQNHAFLAGVWFLGALAVAGVLVAMLLAGCQLSTEQKEFRAERQLHVDLEARYLTGLWCDGEPVMVAGDAQRAAAFAKRVKLVCG